MLRARLTSGAANDCDNAWDCSVVESIQAVLNVGPNQDVSGHRSVRDVYMAVPGLSSALPCRSTHLSKADLDAPSRSLHIHLMQDRICKVVRQLRIHHLYFAFLEFALD